MRYWRHSRGRAKGCVRLKVLLAYGYARPTQQMNVGERVTLEFWYEALVRADPAHGLVYRWDGFRPVEVQTSGYNRRRRTARP